MSESVVSQLSLLTSASLARDSRKRYWPKLEALIDDLKAMDAHSRIDALNDIRAALHEISPLKDEPVDFVRWVESETVVSNVYNPNKVAPPEMKLLEHSINQDGFTQPIVVWRESDNQLQVIDGFHRNRIGKESKPIRERIMGYLPVVIANEHRLELGDRMSATVRHNRARGKHTVEGMSDIVVELKRRNWSTERICRELGMDEDEVLRLCQITGMAELFKDQNFSRAWDVEGEVTESDFQELTDRVEDFADEVKDYRNINTDDPNRIFHTHDKWECFKAGFYATTSPEGMSKTDCETAYRDFLSDTEKFADALQHVITEWKHSCEHYLTNVAMNRIAWLGQASACYALGISSQFRGGFHLLTPDQQITANETALAYLNKWLEANGRPAVTMDEAISGERQSDIY